MPNAELIRIVDGIARDKNIEREQVYVDIEQAVASGLRKQFNTEDTSEFAVTVDRVSGDISVNRQGQILPLSVMGRIGAQTVKQVMIQLIRQDERGSIYEEFKDRVGTIVTGTIARFEGSTMIVSLGRAEGLMPRSEQIPGEQHQVGERIQALIMDEAPSAPALVSAANQAGFNLGYLAYNVSHKPVDKLEVRKALNMAINKKAIIDAVFQGTGVVAKNPIPPTMWSYKQDTVDDPYDPDGAKKLLDEAGVKDLKMKVWAMPVQRPYNPNAKRMAELIQADFAKVGVTAEIVTYEWGEYLKRSAEKDRDGAVLMGWTGDNGDPDNFLAVLLGCDGVGGTNRAQWCNKDFNDLVKKAATISDQAERTKLYEQAQAIFKDQAPWATIAHSVITVPMAKKVQGFVMDPLGHHQFGNVDVTE